MFLLRSSFWLTVAFLVIRPEADMGATASALSSEAMARGSQFVAEQIEAIECDTITCIGGKALASAAIKTNPAAVDPMHNLAASGSVPLPRPRPDRAG
ncbi:hypothetical protein [Devosia chinhatensis]|uniref:Uncharacterized protein n=1 Tax=Devosia chinhatensis TaxID=429727 RepID=A0A0F5FLF3_9HYPH|nr:hypothetical protein [Devosia chinhatensis]KKB09022.1 hypothetical protein VE26_03015 [Devosia chinhatensis]